MAQLDEIVGKSNIQQVLDLDKALIALDETFKKVLTSSQTTAGVINTQTDSYTKLKTVQDETVKQSNKLSEAEKEAQRIAKEQAATLAALDKQRQAAYKSQATAAQKAYDAAQKQAAKEKELADAINMEVKSINDARKQNEALTKARNALNQKTAEGKKQAEIYNKAIDKNTQFIRENSDAATKQRMNIGNYGSALKGIGSKLMGAAAAFGLAIGAAEAFKKVINSTGAAQDFFARQTEGLKSGIDFLGKSLTTLNFTNLISGFREAFREGKRYADTLDEIEDRQIALGIATADIESQILDQKLILKSNASSIEAKEAAIAKVLELEQQKLDETQKLNDQALDNELQNAAIKVFGEAKANEERKALIKDYVAASGAARDQQIADVEKAQALQDGLNKLIKVEITARGQTIQDTRAYNAALAALTPEELKLLDILQVSKLLTDEKRDAIGKLAEQELNNVNDRKNALLELERYENRLRSEYLKQEKDLADQVGQVQEKVIGQKALEEAKANEAIKLSAKGTNAEITADLQSSVNQQIAIKEGLLTHSESYLEQLKEQQEAAHQEELERIEAEKEAKMQAAQMYLNAAADYGGQLFEINQMLIDNEVRKMEEAKAYELQMAGDNVAKREAIEKKYDKEATKLKQKQAKQDKAQALFNAIIKTAQAVLAGLAFGPPLGYVFAALNAVLGGIQIGLIASQPIPQFEKGTESAPDGVISVAEKGQELIKTRSGKVLLAKKPTLLAGMKGAKIFTNEQTEALLAMQNVGYDSKELRQTLDKNNRDLIRAIENKREVHITPPRGSRITAREGNYYKNYLATKIR